MAVSNTGLISRSVASVLLLVCLAACQPAPSPVAPTPTVLAPTATPPMAAPTTPPPATEARPTTVSSPTPLPEVIADGPADVSLFDYDAAAPLDVVEAAAEDMGSYTQIDLSYASPQGGRVPAWLLVPDGDGPFAGMVLMHGSSGDRNDMLDFGRDLAPTGAVVLLISGPSGRPERLQTNPYWINFTDNDRAEQIQLIIDLRHGVDVLLARPQVDPARLGYVGYSYGAAMGGLLAGVEPRIKAYGFMVGDGGLVAHFTNGDQPLEPLSDLPAATRARWLSLMRPIEPIAFVGRAAPSALFFQNALNDTLVSREDAEAYQAAGSEPKRIEWYNSGHGLPRQAYLDMVAWLEEQIGLDAGAFVGPPG